jgi:hypothetical protein
LEHPLQLAFTDVDRSSALDERIRDLLSAAESYRGADDFRVLYYANEALLLAEIEDQVAPQLTALSLIIAVLVEGHRADDATPYIVRGIDLANELADPAHRTELLALLTTWAVEVEQLPDQGASTNWRDRSPVNWAKSMIARLEHAQSDISPETGRRADSRADDGETGLVNAVGLAAELLALEDQGIDYALIQIRLADTDHHRLVEIARRTAPMVGDRGIVARNGDALLTAVLPGFTGIAAMAMAEHLRDSFTKIPASADVGIGIGVAIKQRGDTSRDVLRRVVDRSEVASSEPGITISG